MIYSKILFITTRCSPYRIPFFEKLAEMYNIEFVFWLDGRERGWNEFGNFHYTELYSSKLKFVLKILFGKFDLVISNFIYGRDPTPFLVFVLCKLLRKPIIYWNEEWYQPRTLTRKLSLPIIKFIVRHSDAFVVPGTASKSHISFLGAPLRRNFISPNASYVDLDHTTNEKARKIKWDLGIGDKKVILYLGRLVPLKGADILIRAFARIEREIKDAFLLIVGGFEDERFKDYLFDLCKKFGLKNVKIQNYVEGKKALYYLLSNIFILPSIETRKHCEAWGLTLNEAMYVGKPVISTDAVGASCDLIKNGVNGYIVKNANIYELYKAMKTILSDDELERKMGEESRKIIANFTYENMVRGFKEAVDKALALD